MSTTCVPVTMPNEDELLKKFNAGEITQEQFNEQIIIEYGKPYELKPVEDATN